MRFLDVVPWLFGGRKAAPRCSPSADLLSWVPPKPVQAPAMKQAQAFVASLQESGDWGVQPRGELLRRYPELCMMEGFVPVKHNALCEALGELLEKRRPLVDGHRITAYVVPEPVRPRAGHLTVIPSGNEGEEIPYDLPKRSRSGTSYAQA